MGKFFLHWLSFVLESLLAPYTIVLPNLYDSRVVCWHSETINSNGQVPPTTTPTSRTRLCI